MRFMAFSYLKDTFFLWGRDMTSNQGLVYATISQAKLFIVALLQSNSNGLLSQEAGILICYHINT